MEWTILVGLLAYFIGFGLGRQAAHQTIADECERLGGFYVGKRTFKCTVISESYPPTKPAT